MSDFICPYCFSKSNTNSVWFQCIKPNCTEPDEKRTAYEDDVHVSMLYENQIRSYPTIIQGRSANSLFKIFGAKNATEVYCDSCGVRTAIRVCPECHSKLPQGIDSLSNLVIAIVGAKETGKSHYIAVLIQQIRKLFGSFNWTLSALDDETISLYKSNFYNPLYVNKRTLEITQSAKGNDSVKKPLLYSLSMSNRHRQQTITLAFFDTAGEDMDSEHQMLTINRYIYNASGIILLLDPLQLPSVREQLTTTNLPQENNTYVGEIINRMGNLIRTGRGIHRNTKIPIPLAVAFSKIDLLHGILGESSAVFQESRHRGHFNLREFGSINGEIREWINESDMQGEFVQHTLDFANVGYFGVSALGGNPDLDGRLPFTPRPIRVDDPFLWLLWKNKFIEGVEG